MEDRVMSFDNHYEAFVSGLLLAVTAPTEEQSQEALALAESIAGHLTADQVEQAKSDAVKRLDNFA
jgi:hypothetical protein